MADASDAHNATGGSDDDELLEVNHELEVLTPSQVATLTELFELFDQQGRGHMHMSDVRVALRMANCEVSRDEARGYAALYCSDAQHGFTLQEFLAVCDDIIKGRPDGFRDKLLEGAFSQLDTDGSGELDVDALKQWGSLVTEACISADPTDDTTACRDEFRGLHSAPDLLALDLDDERLATDDGVLAMLADLSVQTPMRLAKDEFLALLRASDTLV